MATLLAGTRLLAIFLATVVLWSGFLLTRPLRFVSLRLGDSTHRFFVWAWASTLAWLVGMRLTIRGEAPATPYFLASNHLSYVDVLAYLSHTDCRLLAKAEVAKWPFFGPLASTSGTHFVDRTRRADLPRVIARIRDELARGHAMIFFPEGTSGNGDAILPFKPSLFEVAVESGMPVYTARISYATRAGAPPARDTVCWWGDMTLLPHLWGMLRMRSFAAQISFGADPVPGADRKELCAGAHAAVAALDALGREAEA